MHARTHTLQETSYLPFTQGPYKYVGPELGQTATFGRAAGLTTMERWTVLRKRAEAYQAAIETDELICSEFAPSSAPPTNSKHANAFAAGATPAESLSSDAYSLRRARLKGLGSDPLGEPVCFIEVNSTDTHAVIWRDRQRKRVVVGFRGTDVNWKAPFGQVLSIPNSVKT